MFEKTNINENEAGNGPILKKRRREMRTQDLNGKRLGETPFAKWHHLHEQLRNCVELHSKQTVLTVRGRRINEMTGLKLDWI